MAKLDAKFIKKELVKFTSIGDLWPFIEVGDVEVDGTNLKCIINFSGSEASFKKYVIESANGHRKEAFAQTRVGTSYFKDKLDEIRDAANECVEICGSDDFSREIEDVILVAVQEKCQELNVSGELGFSDDAIDELSVEVVLDRINRVYVSDHDVFAYHDEIKENHKTGQLEGWMVEQMNLLPIADNEYDGSFQVEVDNRGLEIGVVVSLVRDTPIDLMKLSTHEVRETYFDNWVDSEKWSVFTNPETEPGAVAALADYFASVASEDYMEVVFYDFTLDEVRQDILAFISSDIESNNEQFAQDGEGLYQDEIVVDEVEKVDVVKDGEVHFQIIDADNLLEWRNEYVNSEEADEYESWVRADKHED